MVEEYNELIDGIKHKRNPFTKLKNGTLNIPNMSEIAVQALIKDVHKLEEDVQLEFLAYIIDCELDDDLKKGNYAILLKSFRHQLKKLSDQSGEGFKFS